MKHISTVAIITLLAACAAPAQVERWDASEFPGPPLHEKRPTPKLDCDGCPTTGKLILKHGGVYHATLHCDISEALKAAKIKPNVPLQELYDWGFPKPTSCEQGKTVEIHVIEIKEYTPVPMVQSMLSGLGLKAGEFPELIALGAEYSHFVQSGDIFALGSAMVMDFSDPKEYAIPFLEKYDYMDSKILLSKTLLNIYKNPTCPPGFYVAVPKQPSLSK